MIARSWSISAGRHAPIPVGSRPRLALFALSLAGLGVACNGSGASDQVTPPIDLGMTSKMASFYSDPNLTLYQVQLQVRLPVRRPTASDLSSAGPAPKGTPYPRAPYLLADDESLEVHYTISNLDAQEHAVWLLVDPWNEFVRWQPGISVVSDEQTTPNMGYDLPFVVPAQSRVDGTLTSDDMHEIAIKLASVENVLGSPQAKAAAAADAGVMAQSFDATGLANNIFMPQNRSNGYDPLYTPWIPPVVAGLTGFDLGLRTTEAANVAIEITVAIKDLNGDRFVASGSTDPQIGLPPRTLSPPGARM